MSVNKDVDTITRPSMLKRIWLFYYEGFKSMTIGKSLWMLVIIKCILLFAVIRLFFMPNILNENYDNDHDRAEAVRSALVSGPTGS